MVTRASNNYGPYQFPEKLIPLMISHALEDRPLPVYGDGLQVRDWLWVEDHCQAVAAVMMKGRPGEIYNIGGNCALPNLEVIRRILKATGKSESLIHPVEDRPGHDRRYAITSDKVMRQTSWEPKMPFEEGLQTTIRWYQENEGWVSRVRSGAYQSYYARNYENRRQELTRLVE
jgi:dTDP-glucose 4,6-dehydratase